MKQEKRWMIYRNKKTGIMSVYSENHLQLSDRYELVKVCANDEELEEARKKLIEETTEYNVYIIPDPPRGELFPALIKTDHCFRGSYRKKVMTSEYGTSIYELVKSFKTMEEAEQYCQEYISNLEKMRGIDQ